MKQLCRGTCLDIKREKPWVRKKQVLPCSFRGNGVEKNNSTLAKQFSSPDSNTASFRSSALQVLDFRAATSVG